MATKTKKRTNKKSRRTPQKLPLSTDPTTAYAIDVVNGSIVAGRLVRLACQRHLDDIRHAKRKRLIWSDEYAAAALDFFPTFLRLAEGQFAGEPFVLEPFQQFIIGSIYGWYSVDGTRRYRTAYVEIGKGNGKSPLAAGIGLYELVSGDEPGAQIYSAAVNHDQASIVFKDAASMVAQSPELRSEVQQHISNLSVLATGSFFRAVSSEHRGLDGKRVHLAIIDELHEHRTGDVVDKMRAGTKGRRNPLIFEITNSGYGRASTCWQHHEYSRSVLEGAVDNDSWFAFVCGLDVCDTCLDAGKSTASCNRCDSWQDEAVWPKANPGLGSVIPYKYLREQVAEAVGMPAKQNNVRRLNFCEWTEQRDRLIGIDAWDACSGVDVGDGIELGVSELALAGRQCFGGLDLALVNDLSALALVFPPADNSADSVIDIVMRFWCPEDDIIRRSRLDRAPVPYNVWADANLITTTPGNVTDFGFIEHEIVKLAGVFNIIEVAYDRTFAGDLVNKLVAEGIGMVPHGQGFLSMGPAVAELLRLVKGNRLRHGAHPILRWNVLNAEAINDAAGNQKIDKSNERERVDGIVAVAMAVNRAHAYFDDSDDGPSILESRGVLSVSAKGSA